MATSRKKPAAYRKPVVHSERLVQTVLGATRRCVMDSQCSSCGNNCNICSGGVCQQAVYPNGVPTAVGVCTWCP